MTNVSEVSKLHPRDLDQSLDAMRTTLDLFHHENDHRAVYLRAQYLAALAVQEAVSQKGRYTQRIFFDAEWVQRLMGRLGTQYFASLSTNERTGERAWKAAHRMALAKDGSVLQEYLLGLNAHLNYDLPHCLYLSLRKSKEGEDSGSSREMKDPALLARRKFDHEQLNNLLMDTLPSIQQVLIRDYGAEMGGLGELIFTLEELLASTGLKNNRERVWWTAMSYLAASSDEEVQVVRDRSDWESAQVAQYIAQEKNLMQRSVGNVLRLLRKKSFGTIHLEQENIAMPAAKNRMTAAMPF